MENPNPNIKDENDNNDFASIWMKSQYNLGRDYSGTDSYETESDKVHEKDEGEDKYLA